MRNNKFSVGIILGAMLCLCAAWTYTWDTTTPAGTDAPSVIDDRIREVKATVQERMNVDHYFPLTGTQVSDTDAGYHRDIHFYSSTGTDPILDFVTADGVDELQYTDSAGSSLQLTDEGSFNLALLTSKTITTPTLTSPVLNTGVSGTAVLDEDDMATDSNTQLATQQSIKAYVDNNVGAANYTPTTYAGEESVTFPNGLIFKQGYNSGGSNKTVTFGAAFPTGIVSASVTMRRTDLTTQTPTVGALATTGFTIYAGDALAVGYYWQSWGY